METTIEFERIIEKKLPYHYLKVKLELFGAKQRLMLDKDQFQFVIVRALQELHGALGAAIAVDVIDFQEGSVEAILQVPTKGLVKVWSALTMYSKHAGKPCHFKVFKVTPHLASMKELNE